MHIPEFKVVCLEETQHYTDKDLVSKCGKIRAVFVYDKSRVTHCCEVTPSYELHYIGSSPDEVIDDEAYELLQEANIHQEAIQYVHCATVDAIPELHHVPFSEDWEPGEEEYATEEAYRELFEEVIGDERANPSF